jgi:ribosomal-protein-alanine N-acetyltransferase
MSASLKSLDYHSIPSLIALQEKCFSQAWSLDSWHALWRQGTIKGQGILHGSHMVGFIIWQECGDHMDIVTFGVDPKHQKKGYGGFLLKTLIEMGQGSSMNKIFLDVKNNNQEALSLYEKFGFKILSQRNNYYSLPGGKTVDALVLVHELHDH